MKLENIFFITSFMAFIGVMFMSSTIALKFICAIWIFIACVNNYTAKCYKEMYESKCNKRY